MTNVKCTFLGLLLWLGALTGAYAQNVPVCVTSNSGTANFNIACLTADSTGGSVTVTNNGTATGGFNLTSLNLPLTTSSTVGVVTVGGTRFFHAYGTNNLFIGPNAGNFTNTGTGTNLGIGSQTLINLTSGTSNVGVGDNSLLFVTSGNYNTCVGSVTCQDVTTGRNNTALGVNSLGFVTTGAFNIGVGSDTANTLTTGGLNICIGFGACDGVINGNYNTVIGTAIPVLPAAQSISVIISDGLGNIQFGCQYPTAAACTVGLPIANTGVAFSALPTPAAGMTAYLTDAATGNCADGTCTTFGTNVTGGGGALKKLIWYNGTNWKLIGS